MSNDIQSKVVEQWTSQLNAEIIRARIEVATLQQHLQQLAGSYRTLEEQLKAQSDQVVNLQVDLEVTRSHLATQKEVVVEMKAHHAKELEEVKAAGLLNAEAKFLEASAKYNELRTEASQHFLKAYDQLAEVARKELDAAIPKKLTATQLSNYEDLRELVTKQLHEVARRFEKSMVAQAEELLTDTTLVNDLRGQLDTAQKQIARLREFPPTFISIGNRLAWNVKHDQGYLAAIPSQPGKHEWLSVEGQEVEVVSNKDSLAIFNKNFYNTTPAQQATPIPLGLTPPKA